MAISEAVHIYRRYFEPARRLFFWPLATHHDRVIQPSVVEKKQLTRHKKVTVTVVTLLKRMANSIEDTARYVAPSKAIAFDTLAVNVRLRANTTLCRAVLAVSD